MTNDDEKNRIGYRYLFDSKGCSLSNHDEVTINLIVSEKYKLQIYFGPKPQYGIQLVSDNAKYFVPGTTVPLGKVEFKNDSYESSKYGPFFFEIAVSTEADVGVSDESITHNHLLKHAEKRRDEFKSVIHLVAGIIGLRFHRQFVLELVNENALAWKGKVPAKGFAGPALELLELLSLNDNGINQIKALEKPLISLPIDELQKYSLIFHWLLRAWSERDNLYSFVALFIPLECVLSMLSDSKMSTEDKSYAKSLRMLVKKHAGNQSEELRSFLDKLVQNLSPTLNERFADLAKAAHMQGWEEDIEAFKKFNRMRNILLHEAGKDIKQRLTIGKEEVRTLSDLVERYVNYFLFKDDKVYRSQRRPKIRGEN
jgi:hypothetical protein